ncbi:MAG: alkaline phosphatase family protein [Balneolaceae bacterium]|nr:alkaline phosphatase family protein [Balneolaceae bacterium]
MKKIAGVCLFILLSGSYAFAHHDENNSTGNVVIISIDGFPADLLWDVKVHIPTIRNLARNGTWARSMVPSNPTLTWPNHTSIVTGVHPEKHCLLFNGKLEYTDGGLPVRVNPRKDKSDLVQVPTLFDAVFNSGLKTAEVNWPATRNANTLHDSFPDVPDNVGNMTDDLRWELYDKGILNDMTTFALWQFSGAGRDEVWVNTAQHLIENRMPNLLLIHVLNVDSSHHRHGVDSEPGYTALQLVDYQIRQIIESLKSAGHFEETTIFITTDHGFTNTPNSILPNVALANHGLLNIEDGRVINGRVQAISNGGISFLYVNDPDDVEAIEMAEEIFETIEGVYKIIQPDDYHLYGLPHPDSCDQPGVLLLASEPGYAFNNSLQGDEVVVNSSDFGYAAGHHGFLNTFQQMSGAFIVAGKGIHSGLVIDEVDIRSIAPTAAYILGVEFDSADGEILYNILDLEFAN